ncbi:MAG: hypothetical protein ACFB9M_06130 [Myxococcota bacterium]
MSERKSYMVSDLLKAETEAELERRGSHWEPFVHQVFVRLDADQRVTGQRSLEDQAVEALRASVEAELTELQPHFEGPFSEAVQAQIFKEGIGRTQEETGWSRVVAWFRKRWFQPVLLGAAATAAWLLVTGPPSALAEDEVRVQKLSFEGSATVVAEEGLTVVWVQGPG